MQNNSYEWELLADKRKMKRILLFFSIATLLAWIAHVAGSIFFEHYTVILRNHNSVEGIFGWPVTLYWWGMFIGIIAPCCMLLFYFLLQKKTPSLALNAQGLFINQQLIRKTLVRWNDISRIEEEHQGAVTILNIYFKDPQQIVSGQTPIRQIFLKGNFKDGEPLKCDNRLVTGDFNAFAGKARSYLLKDSK